MNTENKQVRLTKIQIEFLLKFKDTDSVYIGNQMTTRTVDSLYRKKIVSSYGGNWWHLTESGKQIMDGLIKPKITDEERQHIINSKWPYELLADHYNLSVHQISYIKNKTNQ